MFSRRISMRRLLDLALGGGREPVGAIGIPLDPCGIALDHPQARAQTPERSGVRVRPEALVDRRSGHAQVGDRLGRLGPIDQQRDAG